MKKSYLRIIVFVAAILSGVVFVSIFAAKWPEVVILYVIWIIGWLTWLIRWHAAAFVYQCNFCKIHFSVTPWRDALSPHMMDTKLLRCPKCGKSDWFKGMERGEIKTEVIPADYHSAMTVDIDRTLYWQIALVLTIYLLLWLYTLAYYFQLPDFVAIKSNHLVTMRSKTNLLLLPLAAGFFPIIELFTCRHAIREGLKSNIYWFITGLFMLILIIFNIIQYFLIDFALTH